MFSGPSYEGCEQGTLIALVAGRQAEVGSSIRGRWRISSVRHRIVVDLNLADFDGRDVDELRPDFAGERPVRFELQWYPQRDSPQSYRITIEIAAAVTGGHEVDAFLDDLGEDLSRWAGNQLGAVFGRKPGAHGITEFRFDDATIVVPYRPGDDRFARGLLGMRGLLGSIGSPVHKRWEITFDGARGQWAMVPVRLPSAPAPADKGSGAVRPRRGAASGAVPSRQELSVAFEYEMLELYRRASEECGLRSPSFLRLVNLVGGVAAAKQLLQPGPTPVGLTRLSGIGRLDLSIEALVASQSKWQSLFTPEEIEIARRRLDELHWKKP
ncbi:MAG TPA: hypothetical protein VMU02_11110 [bacterium]|nr:hypothetical protein [bacterium]